MHDDLRPQNENSYENTSRVLQKPLTTITSETGHHPFPVIETHCKTIHPSLNEKNKILKDCGSESERENPTIKTGSDMKVT